MSTERWPIFSIGCAEGRRAGATHSIPESEIQRILTVCREAKAARQ